MLKLILTITALSLCLAAQTPDQFEVKELSAKDVKALQQASQNVEDATRMLSEAQAYLADQKSKSDKLRSDILLRAGVTEWSDTGTPCNWGSASLNSVTRKSVKVEIRGKYVLVTEKQVPCFSGITLTEGNGGPIYSPVAPMQYSPVTGTWLGK